MSVGDQVGAPIAIASYYACTALIKSVQVLRKMHWGGEICKCHKSDSISGVYSDDSFTLKINPGIYPCIFSKMRY